MGNSPHLTASAPHPFVSTMVPHSLARIASVICTVDAAPWLIDFGPPGILDRKSTRLNSSHVKISYAVFCLTNKKELYQYFSVENKKKKKHKQRKQILLI